MKRSSVEKILDIKREKGWSWEYHLRARSAACPEVLIVGALLGQMKLTKPLAERPPSCSASREAEERMLNEVPKRGNADAADRPADLSLLRNGDGQRPAWKALIEEEFGDGIMSAIDFDMRSNAAGPERRPGKLTMSGKFLPYKYYGNEQGLPEYGYKEE